MWFFVSLSLMYRRPSVRYRWNHPLHVYSPRTHKSRWFVYFNIQWHNLTFSLVSIHENKLLNIHNFLQAMKVFPDLLVDTLTSAVVNYLYGFYLKKKHRLIRLMCWDLLICKWAPDTLLCWTPHRCIFSSWSLWTKTQVRKGQRHWWHLLIVLVGRQSLAPWIPVT